MDDDTLEDRLAKDLVFNVNLEYYEAVEVVDFLIDNDYVTHETLKDIYE